MAEIKVTFPISRAVMYPAVVKLASQFGDSFTPADDRSKINTIELDSKNVDSKLLKKLRKLWSMAKPIKGSGLTIDDVPAVSFEATIGRTISCMEKCDYAEDADDYCNGKDAPKLYRFGCRELNVISSNSRIPERVFALKRVGHASGNLLNPDNKVWSSPQGELPFSLYAKEIDNGWVFDTKDLKKKARSLAAGRVCQMCPHFSWDRFDKEVDLKCVTSSVTFSTMTKEKIFGIDQIDESDYDD